MKVISQLVIGCMLVTLLFLASLRWAEASESTVAPLMKEWQAECVECLHTIMSLADDALQWDAAGHPHLAYGGDQLYHTWHDGTRWQTEIVDPEPWVGHATALALDSQGRAHIAYTYYDGNTMHLNYARWNGTSWVIQRVRDVPQIDSSSDMVLVLDKSDHPRIAYSHISGYTKSIVYLYQEGTTWVEEVAGNPGRWSATDFSLRLDSNDQPHISYSRYLLSTSQSVETGYVAYTVRENGVWNEQLIEVGGRTAGHSLALDAQGNAHISYLVANPVRFTIELRYSVWNGSSWSHESLEKSPEGQGVMDGNTSLALDAQGQPHIGYYDPTGEGLEYASFDGSAWSYQSVAPDSVGALSLGMDATGTPLIVYLDSKGYYSGPLKAARWNGSAWTSEDVDQSNSVLSASMLLDETDHAHFTYQRADNSLIYARFDGQSVVRQTIDEDAMSRVPFAIDAQGNPHVAYLKYENNGTPLSLLTYARFDGAQWQRATVDSMGCYDSAGGFDIALDSANRPHMVYCAMNSLRYATFDGTQWITQTITEAGPTIGTASLVLDSADHPHISFTGYTEDAPHPFRPRYAHWDGARWLVQRFDEEASVGSTSTTSLALDENDRPHIAYAGRYARWDGSHWLIELLVTGPVENPMPVPSLALDSQGRPHIGYGDGLYVRWDGQRWVYETVVSSNHRVDLALDSLNQPHLSYLELGDLKYARLGEVTSTEGPFTLYMPITIR